MGCPGGMPRLRFALDPSLEVSQYAHTAWKIREGFATGPSGAASKSNTSHKVLRRPTDCMFPYSHLFMSLSYFLSTSEMTSIACQYSLISWMPVGDAG